MSTVRVGLPFGAAELSASIPEGCLLGSFEPQEEAAAADEPELLRQALAHPIGAPPLRDLVHPGQKVAVVTSDLTRPCPSDRLLPPILDELSEAGLGMDDVTVVMALGLHRPMAAAELRAAAGPAVWDRVQVINHDPDAVVRLGVTAAGTPVEIFTPVVEADLRVCLGNLEFHYFAGYSGGGKAILPGCASRPTVTANHGMMVHPEAAMGVVEGNPVRADLEEGAAMVGVDFILNVVVDGRHRVVAAVAGHARKAHQRGCGLVRERGTVAIPRRADIVVVSAGGHPKDLNLYQAQKALDNAVAAVRPGGIIIWVAECSEGPGNSTFDAWLREAQNPDELLERIQRQFVLGGHKAAAVAVALKQARIYLVSALASDTVAEWGLVPFADLARAVAAARSEAGAAAEVIVLPQGGSVLPSVRAPEGDPA